MSTMTEAQRDKLVSDLKNVIHDAEELLRLSAGDIGAEATAMHVMMMATTTPLKVKANPMKNTAMASAITR